MQCHVKCERQGKKLAILRERELRLGLPRSRRASNHLFIKTGHSSTFPGLTASPRFSLLHSPPEASPVRSPPLPDNVQEIFLRPPSAAGSIVGRVAPSSCVVSPYAFSSSMASTWGGVDGAVPDAANFSMAICFAIGFVCARFLLDTFVYQPLSIRLVSKGAVPLKLDESRQGKIVKCSESLWKLTYYVGVQLWALSIMRREPWSMDTKAYFTGWPDQELRLLLKLFYMCQCGFYVYSIGALVTWETRRKDFAIMMSHHIITTMLIGFSYSTRFFRIGTIILALHDASDVFMEAAKIFKYSEREMAASICFGLFAISWLILRLMFFPFWIIKASSYYSIESLRVLNSFPTTLYYLFNTMLLTLLVFHIYWWILIFSMIRRQLENRGQVGEDIRSDSEDGD